MANDADELRAVFLHQQESYGALQESGFHQAISMMSFKSKEVILLYMTDYHCLLKVKAAMDQFVEGLEASGVHTMLKQYSSQLREFFVSCDRDLKAGNDLEIKIFIQCNFLLDDIRALWKIQFSDENDSGEDQAYVHLDGFLDECEGSLSMNV